MYFFPTKTLLHFPVAPTGIGGCVIILCSRLKAGARPGASSDRDSSSIPSFLAVRERGKGKVGLELGTGAPSRQQSHSFGPFYLGDHSRVFSLPGAGRGSWGKGCACGHQLIFRQRQEAFFVCVSVLREFQGWNKAALFHYFPSGRSAQAAQNNFIPAVI